MVVGLDVASRAACATDGNFIWLFGGTRPGGCCPQTNALWRYDIRAGLWTYFSVPGVPLDSNTVAYGTLGVFSPTNWPGRRDLQTGVGRLTSDGLFYVFGGTGFSTDGGAFAMNDLWAWDVRRLQWAWMGGANTTRAPTSASAPGDRTAMSLALLGDTLYVYGGEHFTPAQGVVDELWRYDRATLTWTLLSATATGRARDDSFLFADPSTRALYTGFGRGPLAGFLRLPVPVAGGVGPAELLSGPDSAGVAPDATPPVTTLQTRSQFPLPAASCCPPTLPQGSCSPSGACEVLTNLTITNAALTAPSAGQPVVVVVGTLFASGALNVTFTTGAPAVDTTLTLATYSNIVGTFSQVNVGFADGAANCKYASGAPQYAAASLSVSVAVTCDSGLSAGAIAGIAVGAVAGGVLAVVAVALLTRHARAQRNQGLRLEAMQDMSRK